MPFLTVGATTLDLTDLVEVAPLEVGDRYEAFDGTERTTVDTYKRRWRGSTRPLTPAEFGAYRSALLAVPPLNCTGDALGAVVQCSASILSAAYVRDGSGHRRIIDFELRER